MDLLIFTDTTHNCFQTVSSRNRDARRPRRASNTSILREILPMSGHAFACSRSQQGFDFMQDILARLRGIRRPAILVQAGSIGARSYRRGPALRRILGKAPPPRSAVVLVQLIDIEADLNARRKKTDAGYNLVRHIEVMIALIAEAAILRETLRDAAT